MDKPKNDPHNTAKISPALVLVALTFLAGIGMAVVVVASDLQNTATQQPAIVQQTPVESLVNRVAPDFSLTTVEGDVVQLSELRGKTIFLNFWATWCVPCRREMPAFQDFIEAAPEDVLLLTVNDGETPEQINAFFQEISVENIPVLLDPDSSTRVLYNVFALPTTYIINAEGFVHAVKFGEMMPGDFDAYLATLR